MKKLILLIFFILISILTIPICFSENFEDFADSYDYDISADRINITGISIKNCSEICTNLTLVLNLSNDAGSYDFEANIDGRTANVTKYFFDENSS